MQIQQGSLENTNQSSELTQEERDLLLMKNRQAAIKEYLEKAPILSPDALTVDRINNLHSKNLRMTAFLSKLCETFKSDSEKDMCVGFKSTIQQYLDEVQKFMEEIK